MQNLHVSIQQLWCHVHHFQCFAVLVELLSITNGAYGINKLLLNT
jgi:hypothetical protein